MPTRLPARIEHLVFAGGGMRGLSYVGALQELAAQGHDFWSSARQLKGVAGSSIGALFAVCIAARVSVDYLLMELRRFTVDSILAIDPSLLFYDRGLDPGIKLRTFIDEVLQRTVGKATITMHELHLSSRLHLIIPITDLVDGKTLYLDHLNAADVSVAELLAISMSLPVVYTPKTFRGHLCVDGGLMDNFPMHLFPEQTTLGLRSCWTHEGKLESLSQYASRVVYCAIASCEHHQWRKMSKEHREHTISVDVGNIKTVEFFLTPDQIEQLMEYGRNAVRAICSQSHLQALLQAAIVQLASHVQVLMPRHAPEQGSLRVAQLDHEDHEDKEEYHHQAEQEGQQPTAA